MHEKDPRWNKIYHKMTHAIASTVPFIELHSTWIVKLYKINFLIIVWLEVTVNFGRKMLTHSTGCYKSSCIFVFFFFKSSMLFTARHRPPGAISKYGILCRVQFPRLVLISSIHLDGDRPLPRQASALGRQSNTFLVNLS